jgi:hypothetical protein
MALQTTTYTAPNGASAANLYWRVSIGGFNRDRSGGRWNSQTIQQPKFGFPIQLRAYASKAAAEISGAVPIFTINATVPDITKITIAPGQNLITALYAWAIANVPGMSGATDV